MLITPNGFNHSPFSIKLAQTEVSEIPVDNPSKELSECHILANGQQGGWDINLLLGVPGAGGVDFATVNGHETSIEGICRFITENTVK